MARFDFTLNDDKALEKLAILTSASKADVVRDALMVYQLLVTRAREGKRFFLGEGEGAQPDKITELLITTIQSAKTY